MTRKLALFMMVSLDGYFEGPDHDLGWHNVDEEFNVFAGKQMSKAGGLLMGRRTYELMSGFWPKQAPGDDEGDNQVIRHMNELPKYVFSESLDKVDWGGHPDTVTLIKSHVVKKVAELKRQPGDDLLVLGSSDLCVTLLENGLLDELRLMVNPVAIGAGTTLFSGLSRPIKFDLMAREEFKSGNLLLYYHTMSAQN